MTSQKYTAAHRELEHLAGKRGLSRRAFMGRAAALGLLPLAAQLWAGGAQAQTPVKGGVFRLGLDGGATTDTLDPHDWIGTNFISTVYNSIFDQLIQIGPDGGPAPMLAETWEPSDDLSQWRLTLRQGVTFHDGRPFTAADVAYSIGYLAEEATLSGPVKLTMRSISDITIEDDHTILLTLAAPDLDFPVKLADRGTLMVPEGTTDFSVPIGTGPYRFEYLEPGVRAGVSKYDGFWTEEDGHFDEVQFVNITDAATRTNAVRSGDVDLIVSPDVATVSRLASVGGVELYLADGGLHYTMALNANFPPFDNRDLQMAIKYGVRRQEFVDRVLAGFGYPGNDNPIGRNYRFYNAEIEQREYDPERARFHWDRANIGSDPLTLITSDGAFSGAVNSAQLVQASLAEAGIGIEIESVPGDGYWSNVWMQVPWCYVYWGGSATVGNQFAYYRADSSWNDVGFANERFGQLLDQAATERDETLRGEMYGEAQQIFHDEAGTVVLGFSSYVHAGSDRLGHREIGAVSALDDFFIARRWWWQEA